MGRLRDYWLEALSTCVTAVLVGFVYTVLAGYAAGPAFSGQPAATWQPSGQTQHAASATLR